MQGKVEQCCTGAGFKQARREFAHLAQTDHNGAFGSRESLAVEKRGIGAETAGVNAELEPLGQRATKLTVKHPLGAHDGVPEVVPDEHRVTRVREIAMTYRHFDYRGIGGFDRHVLRARSAEAELQDLLFGGYIIDCGDHGQRK